ncbi:ANTAR domain-containing protein [Pedococcus bigeumensis]|uniref:ANTAR domain-containing protein n=1 Tax=Pedococcus bigeumensis TaxID=433644 RepID=A0A502CLD1_9MICO|nr:ANTAR domain-containing protein [Pedococcus bigeumensis]TPG12501.1 ANTAR domain-containing protein [Pedococcus bigeumensis]
MTRDGAQSDGKAMSFEYEVESGRWTWSQGLRELHNLAPGETPTTDLILDRMVEKDRAVMLTRFRHHLDHAGPYSCVYSLVRSDGHVRRVIFVGESEAVGGKVKRLPGFVVDLTEPILETARAAVAASAEHRAAIEQAKGALMLTFGVEEDGAFELLRAYSSRHNIKLAEVAHRIVAGLCDPAFSRDEPVRSLLDIVMALEPRDGASNLPVPRS